MPAVMYCVAWPSVKFGNVTPCLDACAGQHSELSILRQYGQSSLSEDQSWVRPEELQDSLQKTEDMMSKYGS